MLEQIRKSVQTRARHKRGQLFINTVSPREDERILDLGGGNGTHIHNILPHIDICVLLIFQMIICGSLNNNTVIKLYYCLRVANCRCRTNILMLHFVHPLSNMSQSPKTTFVIIKIRTNFKKWRWRAKKSLHGKYNGSAKDTLSKHRISGSHLKVIHFIQARFWYCPDEHKSRYLIMSPSGGRKKLHPTGIC